MVTPHGSSSEGTFGGFKVDKFSIPLDATVGKGNVNAKSGGNFKDVEFSVSGENEELEIFTDKSNYNTNELMNLSGSGARLSATITIKIFDSEGIKIDELNITAKSNGEYLTTVSYTHLTLPTKA